MSKYVLFCIRTRRWFFAAISSIVTRGAGRVQADRAVVVGTWCRMREWLSARGTPQDVAANYAVMEPLQQARAKKKKWFKRLVRDEMDEKFRSARLSEL
jgi:hypothetical protein